MNPFRSLLKSSGAQPSLGTWILSASPIVAEAMGHAGFEWGVIDMEHTPLDMMGVVHLLQAVGNTRMVPLVRVPWNDAVTVKRVLDAGAHTLLVPFVQNADEARCAVAATRYPPAGIRSVVTMSRASRFGTAPNYLKNADQQMGVVVQLETEAAVRAIESIGAVDGVDAVFISPSDLAGSMGHAGQLLHPAVVALVTQAVERCHTIGKPIGTLGHSPDQVVHYRAMGFNYLAVSSDLGLLMRGAGGALQALRTSEGEHHVHTLTSGTRLTAGE
ncbi:MAG: 2-dehydro-3-deoxyglucarate aldolase [Burkholderiaceae bacterium]|jgi:2-keto-3-deoxy-L-rhamnonate aldolase RhmA|nr:2-dehydro-3-deoxyglucarate aldolase [Burkholderiaceae bacterium]